VIRRSKRGSEVREKRIPVTAHIRRQVRVRSSTGQSEVRYIVATQLRIGSITKEIEISLASRDPMRYRMLLGRSALGPDFLIDTSRAGIHL
jgi:ribosomal protein S6--L-glutamate ligase